MVKIKLKAKKQKFKLKQPNIVQVNDDDEAMPETPVPTMNAAQFIADGNGPSRLNPSATGPKHKLEMLLQSKQGVNSYQRFLMALSSRASVTSSCRLLGVTHMAIQKWIKEGRRDSLEGVESLYAKFFEDISSAIAIAVTNAEIEAGLEDPKWYLTRGPGRIIVNDAYNAMPSKPGEFNYHFDGSITGAEVDDMAYRENTKSVAKIESQPQSKGLTEETLQALKALRESGIDINEILDRELSKKLIQTTDE